MTFVFAFIAALLLFIGAFVLAMLLDSMVAELLGRSAFRPKLWVVVAALSCISLAALIVLTQSGTRGNSGVIFGLLTGGVVVAALPARIKEKIKMPPAE